MKIKAEEPALKGKFLVTQTAVGPRLPASLKPLIEADHFLSFPQHKQRNLVWTKGTDALEGELQSSSEVDFYIDQVK